ncbi:uncharacterized protein LOC117100828 isoform X2 [Anneissia japonica]|uniref:uncharacterized protein LOC117100828 isoform X2 n=1 Tax=Anneissia japonica TaxID=1529436 RepID=UPI001425638D|nr:uncharacterized protein LOC117100828 isoform X2 [Anneissia japonica]
MSKLSVTVLILSLAYIIAATPLPGRRNVCSRQTSCVRTRQASTQDSFSIKGYRSCGWWGWGRCTTYRLEYRVRYYVQYYRAYSTTYYCCNGWLEDAYGRCTIRAGQAEPLGEPVR